MPVSFAPRTRMFWKIYLGVSITRHTKAVKYASQVLKGFSEGFNYNLLFDSTPLEIKLVWYLATRASPADVLGLISSWIHPFWEIKQVNKNTKHPEMHYPTHCYKQTFKDLQWNPAGIFFPCGFCCWCELRIKYEADHFQDLSQFWTLV